jgi:hypothetical protein
MSRKRRRYARLANDDYLDDDMAEGADDMAGDDFGGGGSAGRLGELCALLRRARLDLGDDVDINNLVDRLVVALRTKLAHEDGDEVGAEELGGMPGAPAEPTATAYLSLQNAQETVDYLRNVEERHAARQAALFFRTLHGA